MHSLLYTSCVPWRATNRSLSVVLKPRGAHSFGRSVIKFADGSLAGGLDMVWTQRKQPLNRQYNHGIKTCQFLSLALQFRRQQSDERFVTRVACEVSSAYLIVVGVQRWYVSLSRGTVVIIEFSVCVNVLTARVINASPVMFFLLRKLKGFFGSCFSIQAGHLEQVSRFLLLLLLLSTQLLATSVETCHC